MITKIFPFKFDIDALVEAYVNGDPVVDVPGCTLNEFLNNEIANDVYGGEKWNQRQTEVYVQTGNHKFNQYK